MVGSEKGDLLIGANGADVLQGDRGHDVLVGGGGADNFIFAQGDGTDAIRDFTVGTDHIVIMTDDAVPLSIGIAQDGLNTVVTFGDVRVVLHHVDSTTLTEADFVTAGLDYLDAAKSAFFTGWDYVS